MRGDVQNRDPGWKHRQVGNKKDASFQVIILGCSGGPREDTITGLLVRATQTEWRKSSIIAVDAGAHLASIIRVLEQEMPANSETLPPKDYSKVLEHGPFAGVRFPHISAKANGLYIFRELLHSFLITHPHLDHISGMGINTPALEYGREAKAIVALPSTIEAIKNHIFNDSIWPNLSDEGHGVGFVTYRRLIEGGNPRLGYGESRGYVNVCDGLATKCWSVSHGKCHRRSRDMPHQRGDSFGFSNGDGYQFPTRRMSRISDDHGYIAAIAQHHSQTAAGFAPQGYPPPGYPPPGYPPQPAINQVTPISAGGAAEKDHNFEPVCSSAFFIRNDASGEEVLIFGDIEPDSLSMSPRNHIVWEDAAPKIAKGMLKAIFIECSFDDSVRNEDLYGHLCPRHLVAELNFLGNRVMVAKAQAEADAQMAAWNRPSELKMQEPPSPGDLRKKRKRGVNGELPSTPELAPTPTSGANSPVVHATKIPAPAHQSASPQAHVRDASYSRRKLEHGAVPGDGHLDEQRPGTPGLPYAPPRTSRAPHTPGTERPSSQGGRSVSVHPQTPGAVRPLPLKLQDPLKGLTVHIIHIKDTLADGLSPGEVIGAQLRARGEEVGLGCTFDVTSCGESIWV